ncbi:hypothetical protein ACFQH3_08975 [Haladaptatus sp. GCM10025707]|uniref:hypothetical protein n=1 Tax=Haladaptatus sp. GCM10025707 TaxID=3252658 RepID=UPI003608AAA6
MEPVGTILIMALVVMGTTAVAAFGAVVIEDTRQQSELERAEQTLTLFDSRAAMVALAHRANKPSISRTQTEITKSANVRGGFASPTTTTPETGTPRQSTIRVSEPSSSQPTIRKSPIRAEAFGEKTATGQRE